MAMMQLPLAVSILLPSLNKARESANRVKCGSNLRQIGQGMLLYANDHGGSYPPDLGSLITAEQLSVETLVCPSSEDSVPPDVLNGTPEQRAAWANQHSSYEYLGTGMANDQRQDQVLAYEKPGNHGSVGMNLLFGDGHVEWMLMPQAQAEIARSKAVQQAAQNQQGKQP
jgi:prepilin-type processing-associated H-X9-DG protein